MTHTYLIGLSEIALKGKNYNFFKRKLIENIKEYCKYLGIEVKIKDFWKRLVIETNKEIDLRKIFGIEYFAKAMFCENDLKVLEKNVKKILEGKNPKSFKIEVKRPNKKFFLTSQEVAINLGKEIEKEGKFKVDLKDPEMVVGIIIEENTSIIYWDKVKGLGGLPLGSEGKIFIIPSQDEEKNNLTILEVAKRGSVPIIVGEDKDVKINRTLLEPYLLGKIKYKNIGNFEEIKETVVALPWMIEEIKTNVSWLKEMKEKFKICFIFPLIGIENKIESKLEVYENGCQNIY